MDNSKKLWISHEQVIKFLTLMGGWVVDGIFAHNKAGAEPEMEYRASAVSMLVEEFWQIAEGYVEVPENL